MGEQKSMLEVANLTKKFGGLVAVNDVTLDVKQGEIVGLIGANGAGKTTLFNMIAGVFEPTSGKVLFNGKEIQGMSPNKICQMGIGRTYQIVKPFRNLTVLENTIVGALMRHGKIKTATEKAREVCRIVDLQDRMDISGASLNLPELKRMELARALATEPQLLLLDEVMAGLNPSESNTVVQLIQRIRESGVTIVVIEHVMKAIMTLSDRIYVLNQGRCIAEGSPLEIRENPEVIKSYLGEGRRHVKY